MKMNTKEIMSVIPHRPPFLLVDRVEEMEPGVRVTAIKNVTMDEPFFQGHFPGEPVMPGVLMVEAMAQAGAAAILSMEENRGKTAYFGALDQVKFRRKVVPGDTLRLEVEIVRLRRAAGTGKGKAYVGDALACEGTFTFIIG